MQDSELSITVGDLIGVPRVALKGAMGGWHDQVVSGVLTGFRDQGVGSLVLDLALLAFAGIDGATAMVNALRSVGPEMCIHVVGSGATANILRKADMGSSIRLYSSTDEIAEYLSPGSEYLTSRWMASTADDTELPLAA